MCGKRRYVHLIGTSSFDYWILFILKNTIMASKV